MEQNPILTEGQKALILSEEKYRSEVRHALEQENKKAPEPKKKKFWDYLNSPFVLLLCSSVLLSIITWAYQKFETSREQQRQQVLLDAKVSAELRYRFDLLNKVVGTSKATRENMLLARSIFEGTAPYRPAIGAFENVNVLSLLYQVRFDLNGSGPLNKIILDRTLQLSIEIMKASMDTTLTEQELKNRTDSIVEYAKTIKLISLKW